MIDKIKARADGNKGLSIAILYNDAGRAAAENSRKALIAAGVPAIARFLPRTANDTSDEKNDANYILQKFAEGAIKIDFESASEEKKTAEAAGGVLFQDETDYFSNDFDDEHQIFVPGLYILGGLPSIGKTSFAWQLADNLASAGESVFYITCEMSVALLRVKTVYSVVSDLKPNLLRQQCLRQNCRRQRNVRRR